MLTKEPSILLSDPCELGRQFANLRLALVHFELEPLIPMAVLLAQRGILLLVPLLEVLLCSQVGLENFALVSQPLDLQFSLLELLVRWWTTCDDVCLRRLLTLYHLLDLRGNTS